MEDINNVLLFNFFSYFLDKNLDIYINIKQYKKNKEKVRQRLAVKFNTMQLCRSLSTAIILCNRDREGICLPILQ